MAEQSAIAWTRSTFNPWIGCTKVGPGCDHCYASVSTPARTMGIQWGAGQARIRTSVSNWVKPLVWNKRAQKSGEFWPVFCSSLADVFDNEVSLAWRADLFRLIEQTPYLTWLLLTKRIGNAKEMMFEARGGHLPLLPHVWLGATITDQAEADRDIPKLLATPAAKRFVSYEPALGPIDFVAACSQDCRHEGGYMENDTGAWLCSECENNTDMPGLDWIIVGGESDQPGMKARPFDVEWARSTVQQCKAAGVPVFVKQLGSNVAPVCDADRNAWRLDPKGGLPTPILWTRDRAGADPTEWPEDLRVQEFPR